MEDRLRRLFAGDVVAWVAGGGIVGFALALGTLATRDGGSVWTVALQASLVACGAVGATAMWRRSGTSALVLVVAVGVLARAVLVPWPPFQSNDIYRYVWDGRLLVAGIDPYVVVPSAASLHAWHAGDWLYPFIDWRDVPTLYPPVDLALYTLGAIAGDPLRSVVPLKCLLLAGDFTTIALLALTLRSRGLPLGRLAVYAWNPLAIVEFGLNGHEEGVAIAFLVATIVAFRRDRTYLASLALAGAVLSKLYPLAFVPAIFARRALVGPALACLALVALAYAPFVAWNRDVVGFLHAFAFVHHFNDTLHHVVGTAGAAAILLGAVAIAAIQRARGLRAVSIVLALELVYLLVSPNVYPWYVVVFAALVPLFFDPFNRPMRPLALALLAWTALAPLAYLAPWWQPADSPANVFALAIEYAPLGIAALVYARRDWRRVAALLGIAALPGCASPANAAASPPRGATFYAANCALCHTPTATSFVGPDLTHVAARRSRASLRAHIATSVPGGTTFSPATVDALVTYLTALDTTTRARSRAIHERLTTR